MASGDDVLGALLLQRKLISADRLAWAIGEMVRGHSQGQHPDLQAVLARHQLVATDILARVAYEARTGGSAFDLEFASLDWMRKTLEEARRRFGIPARPATRGFASGEQQRRALIARLSASSDERQRPTMSSEERTRRRATTQSFDPAQLGSGERLRQPSGLSALAQPSGLNALAQPSGLNPLAQPSGLNPLQQPSGLNPLAQPSGGALSAPSSALLGSQRRSTRSLTRKAGHVWGRYEIQGEIGRGAMGAVYRAVDLESDRREVAIKVLLQGERARGDLLERFRREARTLKRLKHPAIVRVLDDGVYQNRAYIAMEFVAGTPLEDMLSGLPLTRGLIILEELANALQHAHGEGVVHRDLKPENILIGTDGKPKIMDFGLAKLLDESNELTRQGDLVGTPLYMSPEQIRGDLRAMGPLCDLWALGVIVYTFLAGRHPFSGQTVEEVARKVTTLDPPPPHELNERIPEDLSELCMTLIDKDPERRYPDARSVAEDIRRYLRGEPVELVDTPPSSGFSPQARTASRDSWAWMLGLAAVFLIVGVGVGLGLWMRGGSGLDIKGISGPESARAESTAVELERAAALVEESLGRRELSAEELAALTATVEGAPAGPARDAARALLLAAPVISPRLDRIPSLKAMSPHEAFVEIDGCLASLKGDEPDARLLFAAAVASLSRRDEAVARSQVDKLCELWPKVALPYRLKAFQEQRANRPSEGIAALQQGLEHVAREDDRVALRLQLVDAYLACERSSDARGELVRIIEAEIPYLWQRGVALAAAVALELEGRLPQLLKGLTEAERDDPALRLARAREWLDRGAPRQALACLEPRSGESPAESCYRLTLRAEARAWLLQLDAALSESEASEREARSERLTQSELRAIAWQMLALHALGRKERAAELFARVQMRFGPNTPTASVRAYQPLISDIWRIHGDGLMTDAMADPREAQQQALIDQSLTLWLLAQKCDDDAEIRRRLAFFASHHLRGRAAGRDRLTEHARVLERDAHPLALVARAQLLVMEQDPGTQSSPSAMPKAARELFAEARRRPRGALAERCRRRIRVALAAEELNAPARAPTMLELRLLTLLEPGDPVTFKLWRELYVKQGQKDIGIRFGTISWMLDPTDPDNYLWYGPEQSAPQTQLQFLEPGLEFAKDLNADRRGSLARIAGHLHAAEARRRLNQGGPMRQHLEAALALDRSDPRVLDAFIAALSSPGAAKEREALQARRARVRRAEELLDGARAALEMGDPAGALAAATRAEDDLPLSRMDDYEAIAGLARVVTAEGFDASSWSLALRGAARRATTMEALLQGARPAAGQARWRLASHGGREGALHAVIALAVGDPPLSGTARDRAADAWGALRVELQRDPEEAGIAVAAACALRLAGAPADAADELSVALAGREWRKSRGVGATLHALLSLCLLEGGDEPRAASALSRAKALGFEAPGAPAALFATPAFQALCDRSHGG